MANTSAFTNTYFELLANETFYHVLELANTFRKCIHCKWYATNMLTFYVRADCDCCSGEDIYLCSGCLSYKYKYVSETRKHVRTVAWRNRSRERRRQKRVAKSRSRSKNTAGVDFVDFADLFS